MNFVHPKQIFWTLSSNRPQPSELLLPAPFHLVNGTSRPPTCSTFFPSIPSPQLPIHHHVLFVFLLIHFKICLLLPNSAATAIVQAATSCHLDVYNGLLAGGSVSSFTSQIHLPQNSLWSFLNVSQTKNISSPAININLPAMVSKAFHSLTTAYISSFPSPSLTWWPGFYPMSSFCSSQGLWTCCPPLTMSLKASNDWLVPFLQPWVKYHLPKEVFPYTPILK